MYRISYNLIWITFKMILTLLLEKYKHFSFTAHFKIKHHFVETSKFVYIFESSFSNLF